MHENWSMKFPFAMFSYFHRSLDLLKSLLASRGLNDIIGPLGGGAISGQAKFCH
jgi:hypothetical protein